MRNRYQRLIAAEFSSAEVAGCGGLNSKASYRLVHLSTLDLQLVGLLTELV